VNFGIEKSFSLEGNFVLDDNELTFISLRRGIVSFISFNYIPVMEFTLDKQDEYRLFLEYVVKMTERRGTITTTYLSVNAAITGTLGLIFKDIQIQLWGQHLAGLALLISGIIACNLWRKLINQYSTLMNWWYEELRLLELSMPSSSQLLTKEFHDLYKITKGKPPTGLTHYENQLTWLFTTLYVIFGGVIMALLIWKTP
jgi:hypothetical protein